MTLDEILQDVDLKVPGNGIENKIKVMWINQVQRILYRDYPLPEAVYKFQTLVDEPLYPLPTDCAEDRINTLLVNNVEYDYLSDNEDAKERFWSTLAGNLFLYPTPTEVVDVLIYYGPRPVDLSETRLTEVPTFPEDYHKLLVLGCAIECAKAIDDVAKANNLTQDYMELAAKADRDFRRQEPAFIIPVI